MLIVGTLALGACALLYSLAYGSRAGLRIDVAAHDALETSGYDIDFILWSRRIALLVGAIGIVGALAARQYVRGLAAAVVLVGGTLSTFALKVVLARSDPFGGDAERGLGRSFPGGHAGTVASVALAAIILAPARFRLAVSALATYYIAAIGIASVVAGGHFPSDVLGAYLVAAGWAGAVAFGPWLAPATLGRRFAWHQRLALPLAAVGGAGIAAALAFALEGGWASRNTSSLFTLIVIPAVAPLVALVAFGPRGPDAAGLRSSLAVAIAYVIGVGALVGFVVSRAAEAEASIPPAHAFRFPVPDTAATIAHQDAFCTKVRSSYHLGQDFGVVHVPVHAAAAGHVLFAGERGHWNGVVLLEHRLDDGSRIYTLYGHLARLFVAGQSNVSYGQLLGISGPPKPGNGVSAHLHFEVKRLGSIGSGWGDSCPAAGYLDPVAFIRSAGGS